VVKEFRRDVEPLQNNTD